MVVGEPPRLTAEGDDLFARAGRSWVRTCGRWAALTQRVSYDQPVPKRAARRPKAMDLTVGVRLAT